MEGEERHQPYRELSVTITLQFPSITIHPPQILLTPVPLETVATATLTLLASGYPRLNYTHTHTYSHTLFSIHCRPITVLVTVRFYECLTFHYLHHDTWTSASQSQLSLSAFRISRAITMMDTYCIYIFLACGNLPAALSHRS